MRYFAHSGTKPNKSDWQTLQDHSLAVARLASELARPFGLEKAAFIAGLFHDLGKYSPAFQKYLDDAGSSVDHSTAGAKLMLGDFVTGQDKSMAELIAYCIAGHHAGLPDRNSEQSSSLERRREKGIEPLDDIWKSELAADPTSLVPPFISKFNRSDPQIAAFQFSMLARALFSCLVDAEA